MLLQIEMVSVRWGAGAGASALLVTDAALTPIATLQQIRSPAGCAGGDGLSFYGKVLPLNGRRHVGVLRLETATVPQIGLHAAGPLAGAQRALCAYPFALNELLFRRGVVFAGDAGLPARSVALLCARVLNDANTAVRLVHIGATLRGLAHAHASAFAAAHARTESAPADPWDGALRAHARQHARQIEASHAAGCSR